MKRLAWTWADKRLVLHERARLPESHCGLCAGQTDVHRIPCKFKFVPRHDLLSAAGLVLPVLGAGLAREAGAETRLVEIPLCGSCLARQRLFRIIGLAWFVISIVFMLWFTGTERRIGDDHLWLTGLLMVGLIGGVAGLVFAIKWTPWRADGMDGVWMIFCPRKWKELKEAWGTQEVEIGAKPGEGTEASPKFPKRSQRPR